MRRLSGAPLPEPTGAPLPPPVELTPGGRGALRLAMRRFYEQGGFFLAAGLSFYVIICIVPFILLLVAGGASLLSDEMVARQVIGRLRTVLPVHQAEMEQVVRGVIEVRGVSSVVGIVMLVLFVTQLFSGTRFVLNRMLATRERGFLRGALFDLWMVLFLTVLFFVTVGLTAGFVWVRGRITPGGAVLVYWTGVGLAVALDTLLFATLYRFVPSVRLPWRSVLKGSLAAATLWGVAKEAFRWYIESLGLYSAVYGSLGVTIALMMWVYYSAIVFVLGAALVRALEERRALRGPAT